MAKFTWSAKSVAFSCAAEVAEPGCGDWVAGFWANWIFHIQGGFRARRNLKAPPPKRNPRNLLQGKIHYAPLTPHTETRTTPSKNSPRSFFVFLWSKATGEGSGKYSWRQDGDEVEIIFKTAANVTKNDVNVHMTSSYLRVDIKGNRVLAGPLHGPIDPLGSTWTHSKKNGLEISLSKDGKNAQWGSLFQQQTQQG